MPDAPRATDAPDAPAARAARARATTLADLGERAAIARLVSGIDPGLNFLGFGDDAAAIALDASGTDGDVLVATTDACARPTHFPPFMTGDEIGSFVVEVNLSDLAAMGARPIGLLLAMGLPRETPVALLDGIKAGVAASLARASANLLGGDLKENPTLTLAATALGRVPRRELLTRAGARPGDAILVTGALGGAGAAAPALDGRLPESFAGRMLRPRARLAEGRALAASGACHACMDLSDGLAQALHAIGDASRVGVRLDAEAVPLNALAIRAAEALGDPGLARRWAIGSGGDYELVAAVAPERAAEVAEAVGGTVVGAFTPDREGRRLGEGARLAAVGHEHFR